MSGKRFKCKRCKLYDMQYTTKVPIAVFRNVDEAYVICSWLNELYDENKQLKQEIKQYWKCRDKWKQEAKELKKENKEVRQELAEQLTLHSNWIIRKDRYEEELLQEIENIKQENKALQSNVEWFYHQLKKKGD